MNSRAVEPLCRSSQKMQSQGEDQEQADSNPAAKSERGIIPEQLALKLLLSFRGLYKG